MSEKQPFPAGLDDKRIRDVLAHYESQTEDEQAAKIEETLEAEGVTLMDVADGVRTLITRKRSA